MVWVSAADALDTKGESSRPEPDMWRAFLAAVESDRPDWHVSAACRRLPTEAFFPERGANDVAKAAKALCETCPVRRLCLDAAMEQQPTPEGVWGGTGSGDRKQLRRRRRGVSGLERLQGVP